METFPRDFKGIWIPKELWMDDRLSYFEKLLAAEIDSLDCGDDHCYAGNDYLAAFFKERDQKISEGISKLKKLGFLSVVSFDGRKRVLQSHLKTIYIKFKDAAFRQNDQKQTEKDLYKHYLRGQTPGIPEGGSIGGFIEPDNITNNKTKKERDTPPAPPDRGGTPSAAQQLAEEFKSFLEKIAEKTLDKNMKQWAKDMELLIRKDGYTPEEIRNVFVWALNDPFWRSNVLSPRTLREKFLQLKLKMGSVKKDGKLSFDPFNPQKSKSEPVYQRDFWPMILKAEREGDESAQVLKSTMDPEGLEAYEAWKLKQQ